MDDILPEADERVPQKRLMHQGRRLKMCGRRALIVAASLLVSGCATAGGGSGALHWLRGQSVLVVAEGDQGGPLPGDESKADSATMLSRALSLLPFSSWPAEVEASLSVLRTFADGPTERLREAAEQRRLPWLLVRDAEGLRVETTRGGHVLWRLQLPKKQPTQAAVRGLRRALRAPSGARLSRPSPLLDVDTTRLAGVEVLARLRERALSGPSFEYRDLALDAVGRWPADPAIRTHAALAAEPAASLHGDLNMATTLNPQGESELLALALSAEQRGSSSRALVWRKLLAELFPDRLDYLPELADLLADHDESESALQMLRAGLAQVDEEGMKRLARGTAPHDRPTALPYADLAFTTGWHLALDGDWELAAHNYLSAEDVYQSLSRPRERSDALNNAGVAMVELGRPLAAAASLRRAYTLRSAQGSPTRAATSGYNLARALADAGRIGQALIAYEDAARGYRETGADKEATETLVERLALLARDGQVAAFEKAASALVGELDAANPDEVELLAAVWFEMGRGRYSFGEQEAALSAYARSLSLWRQLGSRLEEGQVLYSLSLPHVALLRFARAHETLVAALSIAVELGDSSSILAIRMQLSELEGLMRTRGDEVPGLPEELKQWVTPEHGAAP